MSRSYSKKKKSNNKYKSLRRTRKVNYKRSKKRSIKRNMSKKTQKGSGIWKRIKSMFRKKKSQSTNNNNTPLINEKHENQKILKDIGTKAEKLLDKLKLNRDGHVRHIDFNISILKGIKEICSSEKIDIKKLKDLKELKEITSVNKNNELVQLNNDINEIKELIKNL
jgi:hypothetical protein